MLSNSQTIIDKYEIAVSNGVYSAAEVDTIVADLKTLHKASQLKRKILLSACLVVVAASALDRGMMRSNQIQITQLPSANAVDQSVRRLQSVEEFADWVECEGIATVPDSYLMEENPSMADVYICKPTLSSYNCVTTPTTPPTNPPTQIASASPTTSPTATATDEPTPLVTTESPSTSPTTGDICYNNIDFRFFGIPDRDCGWVQNLAVSDFSLYTDVCSSVGAANCPAACGVCCADNPDSNTFVSPFQMINCSLLASRFLNLCNLGVYKTICPVTCNTCAVETSPPVVTDAPVPAPVVTDAPVPAPVVTDAPVPAPVVTDAPVPAPVVTDAPVPAPVFTDAPTLRGTAAPSAAVTAPPSAAVM